MEQNQFDESSYQEVFLLLKERVFTHLSDAMLHNIINQSDQLHLHSGEILFSEGDEPNYVYIVIHGRLGTHLSVAQSLDESPTGLFPRGALIGEVGVIMDSPRTMAVIAHQNTRLLRLSAAAFKMIYSSVIAENPKQMQELYLMQLNRNKKLFTRMREGICYTFKILVPLQENLCIEPIINAIEEISQSEKKLYVLKADQLKAMNNQNDRIAYLEKLESIYQNILIIMSLDTMDFIDSILDIADKVILIANGDEPPCDNFIFKRLVTVQNRSIRNTHDLILIQNNKSTYRYGHQWTSLYSGLMVYYYFKNDEDSLARLYRYFSGQQIGLVLGGAGYRGMAYIGVLKALMDYNIPIDVVGGTSMGAIVGAAFIAAADMTEFDSLMQALEIGMRHSFSWKELDLPIHSIFTGHGVVELSKLSPVEYIEDMPIPFFCVSCDLSEKKEVHHTQGRLADALIATSALPGLLPPAVMNGHLLVDGGVANNLPVDVMCSYVDNSGTIISTDFSKGGKIHKNYIVGGRRNLFKSIKNLFLKKGERSDIGDILLQSLLFSQDAREKENIKLSTICIRPELITSSLLSSAGSKKAQLIKLGYDATVVAIQEHPYLAQFLKKK